MTLAPANIRPSLTTTLTTNLVSINTIALTASTHKAGYVFQVPHKANGLSLTRLGFHLGTVTTPDTITLQLESVDATTGLPSGIIAAGRSVTVDITGGSNMWFWGTLGTAYTVTGGQIVAMTLNNGSTPGSFLTQNLTTPAGIFPPIPSYVVSDTGAGWAKTTGARLWPGAVDFNGVIFPISGMFPWADGTAFLGTYTWSTANDKRGIAITMPFPFRPIALYWFSASAVDQIVKIFDSDASTVLETVTADKDIVANNTGTRVVEVDCPTLQANTEYRITVEPSGGNAVMYYHDVDAAADRDAWDSADCYETSSTVVAPTGLGDWTNTTTRRPMIGVIVDAFDAGGVGPRIQQSNALVLPVY